MDSIGYIIQDITGVAICGAGETVDEAWQQVVDVCAPWTGIDGEERDLDEVFASEFLAYGATRALLDYVRDYGGADIRWRIVGGVACTVEEAGE